YCNRCDLVFTSERALQMHKQRSDAHHICEICEDKDLTTQKGLIQHNRQKHWYCSECNRVFQSESNLQSHMNSALHRGRTIACMGEGCSKTFPTMEALLQHFESGTCPSGITREGLDRTLAHIDQNRIFTNPARLTRGSGNHSNGSCTVPNATVQNWNGRAYECPRCDREFRTLDALDKHMQSPTHAEKTYRCPRGCSGCGKKFRTASALMQHANNGSCNGTR
ncbi:hypothetical protein WOLCODRAFT_50037, partial [Wolfiporia cocos MD-104 SS10]